MVMESKKKLIMQKHNIPIPINLDSPYSIDQNLWGRSNECGILKILATPPEDAYDLTNPIENTPDTAEEMEIVFENGLPISINNQVYPLDELILN